MERDLRASELFQEAERLYAGLLGLRDGAILDLGDPQRGLTPFSMLVTATLQFARDGSRATRVCEADIQNGSLSLLTSGPNSDRCARRSPDGLTVAFLSDRGCSGDFQLFLLDAPSRKITACPPVDGWAEYLEWSPDGRLILLGVAGRGADMSSGEGARKTHLDSEGLEPWMPEVVDPGSHAIKRSLAVFDCIAGTMTPIGSILENVWEASWCGTDRVAAIASTGPEEGAWYASELYGVELATGELTTLYKPERQIALPRGDPGGQKIAFIESVASDRGFVAGNLQLYDLSAANWTIIDTAQVAISHIEWRSQHRLLAAGHRGLETVVLLVDILTGTLQELWSSKHLTASGNFATIAGLDGETDFAFICEGFFEPPQIAAMVDGSLRTFGPSATDPASARTDAIAETCEWRAPDGLQLEGWLLRPVAQPPFPTILAIHDGPVFHWRPQWLGRAPWIPMLLRRGYAIFLPNMRGSSGRGGEFAAKIIGDIGGADAGDLLSGIDCLVIAGVTDPERLGVTGLSYGGLMTCWLTTQDTRFKGAVAVGPAVNHVSHHLSCNIPQFVPLFLQDHYTNLDGAYYARSPILHAHKSRTPTLLVCGRQDRCTPAEEAMQFHTALVENGVETVLVMYPQEGHGVRGIPALFDFSARCVSWFEQHV